jgi:hypothetical protein
MTQQTQVDFSKPTSTSLRAVAIAGLPFLWLGMVAAISLLEAPLRFQADGVSRTEALAIGQLVFPALNAAEVLLAIGLLAALWPSRRLVTRTWRLAATIFALLIVQVAAIRPILHASTVEVLAGTSSGGSGWHWVYIALEGVKIVALLALGYLCVHAATAILRRPRLEHRPVPAGLAIPTEPRQNAAPGAVGKCAGVTRASATSPNERARRTYPRRGTAESRPGRRVRRRADGTPGCA